MADWKKTRITRLNNRFVLVERYQLFVKVKPRAANYSLLHMTT